MYLSVVSTMVYFTGSIHSIYEDAVKMKTLIWWGVLETSIGQGIRA